jgi:hypothetical protein
MSKKLVVCDNNLNDDDDVVVWGIFRFRNRPKQTDGLKNVQIDENK